MIVRLNVSTLPTKVPLENSFLAFSLADPRRAATREVAIADEERGCHQLLVVAQACAPSKLTDIDLKQGHC